MRDDSMANGGVGESLLACATADVMLYEDTSKQWIRPDDPSTANSGAPNAQKLSNVQLIQDNSAKAVGFRIVAVRICDRKLLINQNIFPKLKYQAATTSFHQWRNEHRQVYGLSFSSEQDAGKFFSVVQQAMEFGSSQVSNDYHHGQIPQQAQQPQQQHYSSASMNGDNGGNGVYQDPHFYQQQQSSGSHYNDGDQESLGSSNGHTQHNQQSMNSNAQQQQQAYRKSSYQVGPAVQPQPHHPHLHHQPAASGGASHLNSLVNANIQRRASQGSNNSSNSSQPGQNIYASANMPGNGYPHLQHQHSVGHAQAPPPAPPPPASQGPALAQISSNAPPVPPPPPCLKAPSTAKQANFADQLKQTQLRKVSNGVGNGQPAASLNRTSSSSGDNGIGSNSAISSKTSTISSTNSGHSDLLSELAATINRRKNANGNGESKEAGAAVSASSSSANCNGAEGATEKKVNGETSNVLRPWQKVNNASIAVNAASSIANNSNASVDSPRVHRKVPSGSSLSSQEEVTNLGSSSTVKGISSSSSSATTINGSSSPSAPATLADLERLKTELVTEFQRELQKSKQDILAALRHEFQQFYQQNR